MSQKTREQLESELDIISKLKEERKLSNDSYALKVYEVAIKVVIGLICGTVITYLIKSVLK